MESFSIDEQTYKDLNIFNDNESSIFQFFKKTRTLGGREKLRQIMKNPSCDRSVLTNRRDSINYFFRHKIELEFKNEVLDIIEFYLEFDKRKSKGNIIDSVADFITRNSSNDYYIIKTGLRYLIQLTRYLLDLFAQHPEDRLPVYLRTIFQRIRILVEETSLSSALKMNEVRLKFYQVNQLDSVFRNKEKEQIEALLEYVYELDVFENMAQIASVHGFSFPSYDRRENVTSVEGLFHPLIKDPVKNDISVAPGQPIVFLTGSNMAGKSSLLKSLGLCVYLAHLGFPVPAKKLNTSVYNGLISTINLPDNMNDGLSHYYSEVKRVKEVALKLASTSRMFIIFDELFRGTNVKDAFDASLLIVSALTKIHGSAFFISTHIVELGEELKQYQEIDFRQMEVYVENGRPKFTYKVVPGISKERLGMYIIMKEGIIELLEQSANMRSRLL